MNNLRNYIEQSIVFQFLSTLACSFQSCINDLLSKGSNNKYVVGSIVIILGSVYPLILKYTRNGQSKYPFMIGVAVCVKNVFMLIYYFARYLTFLYNDKNKRVYNYQHIEIDNNNNNEYDGNSSFHASHHHFVTDNTSHQLSPHFAHYVSSPNNSTTTYSASKAMMNLLGSTPSKISWALNVLKSPDIQRKKAKDSSSSLHKLAKNSSEIEVLSGNESNSMIQGIEMETISTHDNICHDDDDDDDDDGIQHDGDINDSDIVSSVASKQIKIDRISAIKTCPSIKNIKHRLKLYCYLAPNALLVLINDILALYTLSFVSVATYAVFMQVTILFIVIVRYFCLNKMIKKSQLLSVCISVFGMIVFELVELEPKIADSTQSVFNDEDTKSDMIGIGLCSIRGILKACDLVYVEWFIHHLNEIPFYEKQAVVSVWFVICSFVYVILYHGNDLFINHRNLFDGFNDITWIFVGYGTFFALMIYLLILRLDSMVMGFCQQMTVLFAVSLDVICFKTKVTASMWVAALIVVIAIIQYSVIQYEHMEVQKKNKKIQIETEKERKPLINGYQIESDDDYQSENDSMSSIDNDNNNNNNNTAPIQIDSNQINYNQSD